MPPEEASDFVFFRRRTILIEISQNLFRSGSGIGAIGFRSIHQQSSDANEWVEVQLPNEVPIDEIVLVPNIWRDTERGFQADGFPKRFRIIAGTEDDREGYVIAHFDDADEILSGVGPLVVPIEEFPASWIRIETQQLSRRAYDQNFVFQLAELLVFSGEENVALRCPVKASSRTFDVADAWKPRYLVDGNTPYLMDSAQGSQSLAYVSNTSGQPALIVDLETPVRLSRIHLHAVDQGDTVPQAYSGDLGIPRHLIVEGAPSEDFSDSQLLLDYRRKSLNETGPIMMWRIPESTCRYVRLTSKGESDNENPEHLSRLRIGFAEIELFSQGINVAKGKPVIVDVGVKDTRRSPAALTDGNNLYGKILPVRQWMNELARRRALEARQPILIAELNGRYAQQTSRLIWMTRLAVLLVVAIGFTVLIGRNIRIRQMATVRTRLAADLHDELGANLHAIGLLGDHAQTVSDSPERLKPLLDRLRSLTERTSEATRYCTNTLSHPELYTDLPAEIRRTALRIMANLEHDISFEGEESLDWLTPKDRVDLFLFYKECLVNISRHSEATRFATQMKADRKRIELRIQDNGLGLSGDAEVGTVGDAVPSSLVPSSLKRRANLLGASVTVETPSLGGTCIVLNLRRRWRLYG